MPYAIGSVNRNFLRADRRPTTHADWGIDGKIGVTSSMTLDLTYNTDFAQVEVDEQQINLTRFNLLFPEKRPFFLENRGLFAVGKSGEVDLFFSRRIGIDDNGELVPIQGGARLTGKASGINVGLLNMQTERVDLTPANNFTAVRVSKDLREPLDRRRHLRQPLRHRRDERHRQLEPHVRRRRPAGDRRGNHRQRICGEDRDARTGRPRSCLQLGVRVPHGARTNWNLSYTEVGDDFNPEVGFLERPDGYRQMRPAATSRTSGRTDSPAPGLREWRPHVSYEGFWGFDGLLRRPATLHIDSALDFENGIFISPALNVQSEGLREPFEVYPGVVVPPGQLSTVRWRSGRRNSDRRKWISGSINWQVGGFLSGNQVSYAPAADDSARRHLHVVPAVDRGTTSICRRAPS